MQRINNKLLLFIGVTSVLNSMAANVWRVYAVPFAAMTDQFLLRQTAWSELYNSSFNKCERRKHACYAAFAFVSLSSTLDFFSNGPPPTNNIPRRVMIVPKRR